ncbi:hypothetical protein PC9H_003803 [Pleurotus ostreatus]|uniref:GYF domain-containing protein n=1 Tax=Pleurotus ostreatus TaxID=5322 RepID=A0A8H7DU90_PLEOS|nr:uncharacterized protein PC9H_003803 [Pleurotus ostreatus]KAF7436969.1 hypothetical protein PC9H_003803 [Pleurotus ostreatus]KAJ8702794.1 hypothetical protein PTI98_001480 [Pleurotus ostreatus]
MVHSDDTEDHWSDAPETLDDDRPDLDDAVHQEADMIQQHDGDTTIRAVAVSVDAVDKIDQSAVSHSSRGASMSTPPPTEPVSDAASIHSLPAVYVTEPDTSPRRPSPILTNRAPPNSPVPPPSPSHSNISSTASAQQRRHRHRSAVEARSSNRLSGFFTNLIHRREHAQASPAPGSVREASTSSPAPRNTSHSSTPSRSSSPAPARPTTPPPHLAPPTLQELGLSLSVVTQDLSPSHFSTSPWSGAFLGPHYLLLCHAQGLDILPLQSPPAPQPYALVRRVSFKSVVVMEQRGVLVAIAGRRDGVRVYALEEVKKAVEWRMEVEIRRERERQRREQSRKSTLGTFEVIIPGPTRDSGDKLRKASLSTPPLGDSVIRGKLARKSSISSTATAPPMPPAPPSTPPLIPRRPTTRSKKRPRTNPSTPVTNSDIPEPLDHPPPYVHSPEPSVHDTPPRLRPSTSVISLQARSRSSSISNVLAVAPFSRRNTTASQRSRDPDAKPDREESSDDEAINIVAAGSSGSQALDERTSAMNASNSSASASAPLPSGDSSIAPSSPRRGRPANLDLSLARSGNILPPEPSPAPTLLTLRQALSHSPSTRTTRLPQEPEPATAVPEEEDDEDDVDGEISLAQALFESRIPELPPLGSTRPQQPIIISSSPNVPAEEEPSSPRTSDAHSSVTSRPDPEPTANRRRRWSLMLSSNRSTPSSHSATALTSPSLAPSPPLVPRATRHSPSSSSLDARLHQSSTSTPSVTPLPETPPLPTSSASSPQISQRSRFIPRVISNALAGRRSGDQPSTESKHSEAEVLRKASNTPMSPQVPPPKLEYVKLPGTKGALMIKAVETAKKSFLAILCGDNGEKVELFAGTYRTALGLSRTFILPDSPRSLELQLQGDDLVEVFLVFSQNVFGLEPATVRVREVRIGRAERRAARRRARELRNGDAGSNEPDAPGDEDTNVNVNIGVSVSVPSNNADDSSLATPSRHPDDVPSTPNEASNEATSASATSSAQAHAEEVVALATAHMGPYTSFQQLSFTPKFPLASIADDYIIPPTYPDFLNYRQEYEPGSDEISNNTDLSQVQFSPPGLPVPAPAVPSKWYYRDPKDVVHGPWKASLMQAWYKDGLLPPDLPVRREDTDFMLLKDLRLQCVDPTQPFHASRSATASSARNLEAEKPLLPPISLLAQPRHFGPPALFYSSRGGHSTAIVDNRGRSVLKGRFVWSVDEENSSVNFSGRMGDIKRLEAFDVQDRSVLIAMRQGGLEAVDLSDALLKPGDESRTTIPNFDPPPSNVNRRGPFVWKIGTPVASSSDCSSSILSSKIKPSHTIIPGKRQTLQSRSPAGRSEFSIHDADNEPHEEMLFLGRKEDEIYICERNSGTFRILRLCPAHHDAPFVPF